MVSIHMPQRSSREEVGRRGWMGMGWWDYHLSGVRLTTKDASPPCGTAALRGYHKVGGLLRRGMHVQQKVRSVEEGDAHSAKVTIKLTAMPPLPHTHHICINVICLPTKLWIAPKNHNFFNLCIPTMTKDEGCSLTEHLGPLTEAKLDDVSKTGGAK